MDTTTLCSGPGCDREARQANFSRDAFLCQTHYLQYWRAGRPTAADGSPDLGVLRAIRPRRPSGECEVVECGMPARHRGLCTYHAERAGRGADEWPRCRNCGGERQNKDRSRLCGKCQALGWRYVEVVGSER